MRKRSEIRREDLDILQDEYKYNDDMPYVEICGSIYGTYILLELDMQILRDLTGIYASKYNIESTKFWKDRLLYNLNKLSNIRIRHNNTRKKRRFYITDRNSISYRTTKDRYRDFADFIPEIVRTQPECRTPIKDEEWNDCFDFIYDQVPIILDLIIDNNKDNIKEYVDSL